MLDLHMNFPQNLVINTDCNSHGPLVRARPPAPSEGFEQFLAVSTGDMPQAVLSVAGQSPTASTLVPALPFLSHEAIRRKPPGGCLGRRLCRKPDCRHQSAFPVVQGYVRPSAPSSAPQSSCACTQGLTNVHKEASGLGISYA